MLALVSNYAFRTLIFVCVSVFLSPSSVYQSQIFHLQVRDQDIPVKRNLVRVIVNVEDTNDNTPWFIGTPYSGRVFESAAIGSAVLQVTALDKDKGQNAEVVYSIESGKCTLTCFSSCCATRSFLTAENFQLFLKKLFKIILITSTHKNSPS